MITASELWKEPLLEEEVKIVDEFFLKELQPSLRLRAKAEYVFKDDHCIYQGLDMSRPDFQLRFTESLKRHGYTASFSTNPEDGTCIVTVFLHC